MPSAEPKEGEQKLGDMNNGQVELELSGAIVWLTITRSSKANALDILTIERLLESLDQAEALEQARALVICGSGRNFCAGADLREAFGGGPERLRALLERLRDFTTRLERSHLVTIAAVQGAARGGGLELALACDLIVAARSATFGDAHLALNLLPGGGATVRLPRCIGWNRAKWMILSAAAIDSDTARNWGLAHELVEDADLRRESERLARMLTHGDGLTVKRVKTLMAMGGEQHTSASLEAEITMLEAHYHSNALQQSVRSFLERDKPRPGNEAKDPGNPRDPKLSP